MFFYQQQTRTLKICQNIRFFSYPAISWLPGHVIYGSCVAIPSTDCINASPTVPFDYKINPINQYYIKVYNIFVMKNLLEFSINFYCLQYVFIRNKIMIQLCVSLLKIKLKLLKFYLQIPCCMQNLLKIEVRRRMTSYFNLYIVYAYKLYTNVIYTKLRLFRIMK